MNDRPLLPGECAVLGLLLDGPMYGYEMARHFSRDGLAELCPIEQSLLYTYLRNVEARGLASWSEVRAGNRPPRKLFELTATGSETIERWLRQPVGRIREVRLDFLLKLYFLHVHNPEAERHLLQQQIAICEDYVARQSARTPASEFGRLVVRSKVTAAESTLDWLVAYAQELEHTATAQTPR